MTSRFLQMSLAALSQHLRERRRSAKGLQVGNDRHHDPVG